MSRVVVGILLAGLLSSPGGVCAEEGRSETSAQPAQSPSEASLDERLAKLRALRAENPAAFAAEKDKLKQQLVRRIAALQDTNPDAYKRIITEHPDNARTLARLLKGQEWVRDRHPVLHDRLQAARREQVERAFRRLQETDPARHRRLSERRANALRQEWHRRHPDQELPARVLERMPADVREHLRSRPTDVRRDRPADGRPPVRDRPREPDRPLDQSSRDRRWLDAPPGVIKEWIQQGRLGERELEELEQARPDVMRAIRERGDFPQRDVPRDVRRDVPQRDVPRDVRDHEPRQRDWEERDRRDQRTGPRDLRDRRGEDRVFRRSPDFRRGHGSVQGGGIRRGGGDRRD